MELLGRLNGQGDRPGVQTYFVLDGKCDLWHSVVLHSGYRL